MSQLPSDKCRDTIDLPGIALKYLVISSLPAVSSAGTAWRAWREPEFLYYAPALLPASGNCSIFRSAAQAPRPSPSCVER